jgi:site-specific recombinase XerC
VQRRRLDAISVQQNGKAASATTIARKRSVFANVIQYAVEKEEMPSNPLDRLSWKPVGCGNYGSILLTCEFMA